MHRTHRSVWSSSLFRKRVVTGNRIGRNDRIERIGQVEQSLKDRCSETESDRSHRTHRSGRAVHENKESCTGFVWEGGWWLTLVHTTSLAKQDMGPQQTPSSRLSASQKPHKSLFALCDSCRRKAPKTPQLACSLCLSLLGKGNAGIALANWRD